LATTKTEFSDEFFVIRKTVSVTSTVSGFVESGQSAKLTFPTLGTIKEILKKEGETVEAGEIIASLTQDTLTAEYNTTLKQLKYLESVKSELVNGPRSEAREVTDVNVKLASDNVERIKQEQSQIVQNAYRKLLSSDLEAIQSNINNEDVPPVISGNYLCNKEGTYTVSVFGSNSPTGYSYKLSGLEEGSFSAWVETPGSLGTCGLFIKFDPNTRYHRGDWTINIPNKKSSSYVTNQNSYLLAIEQKDKAISAAELALELARKNQNYTNAKPTVDSLNQANLKIEEARSLLSVQETRITDRVIRAPFTGIITDLNMKAGEVSDSSKTISLIGEGTYTLKATVPEIDVKNVKIKDLAVVVFDAAPDEEYFATIEFISPLSTNIAGVSYYETHLLLSAAPPWLREGLNADIEIITEQKENTLAVPKQYVYKEDNKSYINTIQNDQLVKTSVDTGLVGNDGYIELFSIPEGTMVVLP